MESSKNTGTGIERLTSNISRQLGKIESRVDILYYGSQLNRGSILPGSKQKLNGLLPLAQEIAKVDLCNILTYVTTNIKLEGINSAVGQKVQKLQEKVKEVASKVTSNKLANILTKDPKAVKEIITQLKEVSLLIDNDTVAVIPQLANSKNYIDDLTGTLNNYTNLNTVPNADIQRLLSKTKELQSTFDAITSINSVQDLIDSTQRVSNLNITKQIQDLQKSINPAQIKPTLRRLSNNLKSINQVVLQVLRYAGTLQAVSKSLSIIIKVLNVVVKILKKLPLPNMYTTTGVTNTLAGILQQINKFLEKTQKRINEIAALVDIIYSFAINITGKIAEITGVIDKIVFNLEVCKLVNYAEITKDLVDTRNTIQNSSNTLNAIIAPYAAAQADSTGKQKTFYGFIEKIVEEELVDEGIKYKRRRAIALDSRGVLVAETPLTFATDYSTLYQELELILRSRGLVIESQGATPSEQEIFATMGLLKGDQELTLTAATMNLEISNFIANLKKGGKKFKKKVRANLAAFNTVSAQELKQSAKAGTYTGG